MRPVFAEDHRESHATHNPNSQDACGPECLRPAREQASDRASVPEGLSRGRGCWTRARAINEKRPPTRALSISGVRCGDSKWPARRAARRGRHARRSMGNAAKALPRTARAAAQATARRPRAGGHAGRRRGRNPSRRSPGHRRAGRLFSLLASVQMRRSDDASAFKFLTIAYGLRRNAARRPHHRNTRVSAWNLKNVRHLHDERRYHACWWMRSRKTIPSTHRNSRRTRARPRSPHALHETPTRAMFRARRRFD